MFLPAMSQQDFLGGNEMLLTEWVESQSKVDEGKPQVQTGVLTVEA